VLIGIEMNPIAALAGDAAGIEEMQPISPAMSR